MWANSADRPGLISYAVYSYDYSFVVGVDMDAYPTIIQVQDASDGRMISAIKLNQGRYKYQIMEQTLVTDSANSIYYAFTSDIDNLSMMVKFDIYGHIIWS